MKRKVESQTIKCGRFSITPQGGRCWMVTDNNDTWYFTSIESMALCLLERRVNAAEAKSFEALLEAIKEARRDVRTWVKMLVSEDGQ